MRADQITQQIQQITKGIKALQESLDQLSASERLEDEKHRLVGECLWPGLIVDLKSAVDNMRLFLWIISNPAPRTPTAPPPIARSRPTV